ncbi:multicopper oxidase [Sphaerobolus stellatus SS14]|uniref:Multicopper oxidase n=1 Tax=Sphaerobolus stellatus (strain SS14) TaxID=990650 RepID=A0A0C9TVV3_SPHS4|nr:multicopper oxidase [Sphaerobolus stellatus SS14]
MDLREISGLAYTHLTYCDGIRGVIVIYDPNDPLKHLYDVDNENTVITLTDGYHTPAIELTEQ